MREHELPPFYLTRVAIKNVRCFENISLNLTSPAGSRRWCMIFGDNGVGKTTLLRCIAMGLCDASSAAGLLREIYGEWHRTKGGKPVKSEIVLELTSDAGVAIIRTIIEPQKFGDSQVRQEVKYNGKSKNFPWESIFACAYGAGRRTFGTQDMGDYSTIDSVYTLFNYASSLQNPELVLRRLEQTLRSKKTDVHVRMRLGKIGRFLDSIAKVLMLEKGAVRLTETGLEIKGPWGTFEPAGSLGDGYQATLAWTVDLLGWAMLYDVERPLSEVRGIVLVDELEQHLHPRWQREIVKLLSDQFPSVQFITTTHTPMCAVGTTELGDDACELVKLERRLDSVVAREDLKPPRGQRADQILTSLLFDLPTAGDDETVGEIARLNQLRARTHPRAQERDEIERIQERLREKFSQSETPFETVIKREVRKALRAQALEGVDRIAADFEVLRQLREMAADEEA